jgi:hypothetical protein
MNTHSSISAEEPPEAEGPLDPDGEREAQLLCVLARLTELGMVLAERLVAQAAADEAAPMDAGEVGAAFAKISRGVRMSVMLEAKLAKERRLRLNGLEAAHEARMQVLREARWAEERAREDAEEEARIERRETAIDDAVREVIRAERPEGLERERLFERVERFWKVDFETDPYVPRSLYLDTGGGEALVSKQIATFCKALGLKPDWDLWKDSFWAIEEAENAAPGSPYAGRGPPLETGPLSDSS